MHFWADPSPEAWIDKNGIIMTALDSLDVACVDGIELHAASTVLRVLDISTISNLKLHCGKCSDIPPAVLAAIEPITRFDFLHDFDLHVKGRRGLDWVFAFDDSLYLPAFEPPISLGSVRTMLLHLIQWNSLPDLLDSVEDLTLCGEVELAVHPKMFPLLRSLTLELVYDNPRKKDALDIVLALSTAFVAARILGYARPLERLTLFTRYRTRKEYVVHHPGIPVALVQVTQSPTDHPLYEDIDEYFSGDEDDENGLDVAR
ncbi:hypothetical protein EXIGLDRAFT_831191 [Exidia glandulosa HHB12029]|uniref:F-box domain-containing protein n=1 Tax=Exidia glandulosa HHB12029 TaxID=1314781 RepID=A0A165MV35_EXIGL|nr:hypothetical protein EXIGLDRAFT_831191 [Exidia glandulosa HHB12029]